MYLELHCDAEERESLELIFSGQGLMPSTDEFIEPLLNVYLHNLHAAATFRYQTAVSGAMRWPWSQEAPMRVNVKLRTA